MLKNAVSESISPHMPSCTAYLGGVLGQFWKGCGGSLVCVRGGGVRVFEGLREPVPKPSSEVSCVFWNAEADQKTPGTSMLAFVKSLVFSTNLPKKSFGACCLIPGSVPSYNRAPEKMHFATSWNMLLCPHQNKGTPLFARQCSGA